ncbi:helix-turn-helix domain-containing protein [Alkalimonas sp. NCh-2]|uniref:MarR family transcriptional regulator n=1 Tax=Alkalimonas sp. NCh-2 TaxID=3144846 RepID=UPI0031F65AC7
MTALRMRKPDELSAAELRLLEFASTKQRSLKAIRQHLALTPQATSQMLTKLVELELITYQQNGMYRTRSRDVAACIAANEQTAATAPKQPAEAPQASNDAPEQQEAAPETAPAAIYDMAPLMGDEEVIDIDAAEPPQPSSRQAAIAAEIEALNLMVTPALPPVEKLDDKMLALERLRNNFLKPHGASELTACIDEIIADLAEIQLHQNRKGGELCLQSLV